MQTVFLEDRPRSDELNFHVSLVPFRIAAMSLCSVQGPFPIVLSAHSPRVTKKGDIE